MRRALHKHLLQQSLFQLLPKFKFLFHRRNRLVEIGKEICDKTLLFKTREQGCQFNDLTDGKSRLSRLSRMLSQIHMVKKERKKHRISSIIASHCNSVLCKIVLAINKIYISAKGTLPTDYCIYTLMIISVSIATNTITTYNRINTLCFYLFSFDILPATEIRCSFT